MVAVGVIPWRADLTGVVKLTDDAATPEGAPARSGLAPAGSTSTARTYDNLLDGTDNSARNSGYTVETFRLVER